MALMERVAEFGSAVDAIEAGFQKREIEASAYRVAQEIDSGERVVVGVNRFALAEEEPYEPLRVDPAIEAEQAARLGELRADRDAAAVERTLAALRRAADGTDNVLVPDARGAAGPGDRGRGVRRPARGLGPVPTQPSGSEHGRHDARRFGAFAGAPRCTLRACRAPEADTVCDMVGSPARPQSRDRRAHPGRAHKSCIYMAS